MFEGFRIIQKVNILYDGFCIKIEKPENISNDDFERFADILENKISKEEVKQK